MRIIYNSAAGLLSEEARARLQRIFFQDAKTASVTLHDIFPRQTFQTRYGRTLITRKDGSIILDVLQDGSAENNWIESTVNLRMTTK